ncbi:unnamed protein product [Phytophthora fragariaefolia]|uniref:Unnamed protein product n=1 Tax=Phytophthora fragariaefolia TaxID=1490495 RepID=A0A9W6X0U7_9STRA|nr:unnamed protein product [Phytophthora fragariaefolia]
MWNRESPVHMDHGRVVFYTPPCANAVLQGVGLLSPQPTEQFKWCNKEDSFNRMLDATTTEVLVQRPGDVVVLNNLMHPSVLLGYLPGTKKEDKWGGILGDVIVQAADKIDSYKFATKAASGFRRGSEDAWRSVLSAYCVMNGDMWDRGEYDEIKANFIVSLDLP